MGKSNISNKFNKHYIDAPVQEYYGSIMPYFSNIVIFKPISHAQIISASETRHSVTITHKRYFGHPKGKLYL